MKKHESRTLTPELVRAVRQYIDENYVPESSAPKTYAPDGTFRRKKTEIPDEDFQPEKISLEGGEPVLGAPTCRGLACGLEEEMRHVGENFQQRLFRLIDEKGMTDVEVYKRAGIDRKLFSKIRSHKDYMPRKKTVIALALAMRLNLDETTDLLQRAELALSPGSRADLIIEYCIRHQLFDIDEVNLLLEEFGQATLGK